MSVYGKGNETRIMKLRAHHLCCGRFDTTEFNRGQAFDDFERKMKQALFSQPHALIMLVEGPDELCISPCPMYANGRCNSPEGDEEAVRKWDSILVSQVGMSYGDCLTSEEWMNIITPKFPVRLCHKCPHKATCRMGTELQP